MTSEEIDKLALSVLWIALFVTPFSLLVVIPGVAAWLHERRERRSLMYYVVKFDHKTSSVFDNFDNAFARWKLVNDESVDSYYPRVSGAASDGRAVPLEVWQERKIETASWERVDQIEKQNRAACEAAMQAALAKTKSGDQQAPVVVEPEPVRAETHGNVIQLKRASTREKGAK